MASSEVDQKFLGKLAKAVENDNPLLSSMLFKILGLSLNLAEQLVAAKKQRRPDYEPTPNALRRVLHIIWLSREGLVMLEQYVLPMVGNYVELKVLAYKLRASFSHIFALFHNAPAVSNMGRWTPDVTAVLSPRTDKGKGRAIDLDYESRPSSVQPTHPLEGGPVLPPPGFESQNTPLSPAFLLPPKDYLPQAKQHFHEAIQLADSLLWGSHSLRLSVKTEYAAFLYECVHDADASRKLAKDTISEVYDATEGMDDDMFQDACELVTVLGKMMRRGLGSSNTLRSKQDQGSNATPNLRPTPPVATPPAASIPIGMENPI
ncbi:14-3-3 domain-containing protein [Dactylonectria macrodidyma]|uniref:14-3-3 domain-containing protein n=1 Tax=Dactylonectria macrodidyma TaxID=307937 RepID=A0A9P9JK85_9HYPO|nr:14-3-3 domain-containing protein [Dactylonectria macrodidyma]